MGMWEIYHIYTREDHYASNGSQAFSSSTNMPHMIWKICTRQVSSHYWYLSQALLKQPVDSNEWIEIQDVGYRGYHIATVIATSQQN